MEIENIAVLLIPGARGSSEVAYLSNYQPYAKTQGKNIVHVIRPNPITKDLKAGLQLGAAVVVKPNGGEPLHNYPFKFPVCG